MSRDNAGEVTTGMLRGTLRHRAGLIVLCALLGLLAGWAFARTQLPVYTATTQVYVYPLTGNPYSPGGINDELTSLETEAEIVGSDAVLEDVSGTTEISESELKRNLQVSVPPNTQLLDISYEAEDSEKAQATAEALAKAYLDYREERTRVLFERRVDSIDDRIEEVLTELGPQVGAPTTPDTSEFDVAARRALNSELINLRAQRVDLLTDSSQSGRITRESDLSGGGPLLAAASVGGGLVLGLLVGLSLAVTVERRRGRVWGAEEVSAAGLPVLAEVAGDRRGEAVTTAVRRVRAAVLDGHPSHSILTVAPCGRGAVEPGFALVLATSLARVGKSVVLVDAHLPGEVRLSSTARRDPGLLELLGGERRDPNSLLVPTGSPNLWSLPRGTSGRDISEYFVAERLSALRAVAERHDYVIVQGPSLSSPEGEALAKVADATLVVVTSGRARMAELTTLVEREGASDLRLVGAVVLGREGVISRHHTDDSGSRQPAAPDADSNSARSTSTVR